MQKVVNISFTDFWKGFDPKNMSNEEKKIKYEQSDMVLILLNICNKTPKPRLNEFFNF